MAEGISLELVRKEPAFHSGLFFPWEKLSHSNTIPDTYSWDFPEIPSVTLKPGEHFEQHLLLEDAFSFDQAGDYHVTFATVFSVLVGEKDGPFADVCPIRISAGGSASFVVTDADNTTSPVLTGLILWHTLADEAEVPHYGSSARLFVDHLASDCFCAGEPHLTGAPARVHPGTPQPADSATEAAV